MNKLILCSVMAATMVSSVLGAVTVDGTLRWRGAANGGSWSDAANWEVTSGSHTAQELLALSCRYDLTGLANGAVLENDVANLKVGAIDFKTSNVGQVTLSGKSILYWKAAEITVAAGNTLNITVGHAQNWSQPDGTDDIILLGNGTIRLAPTSTLWFYKRGFQPCNSVTFAVRQTNCDFSNTHILQWDSSTLMLEESVTLGHVATEVTNCKINLNGYTLKVGGAETSSTSNRRIKYVGRIYGEGSAEWFGGEQVTLSGEQAAVGTYVLYDGKLTLPTVQGETLGLSLQGGGKIAAVGSMVLAGLSGEGATGQVVLPNETTLTVKNNADAVFKGSVVGAANVVKDGSGELILDGANTWTGETQVKNGTLTVRGASAREGLVAHWRFEDSANLGTDSSLRAFNMTQVVQGDKSVSATQVADGAHGCALDFPASASGDFHFEKWADTQKGVIPTGAGPISVDFWIRTTGNGGSGHPFVFGIGAWADFKQMAVWLKNTKLIVCCMNWSTSDTVNSPVVDWPELFDGTWHHVAVTYADRALKVYCDGVMKKSTTMTQPLNLPSASLVNIGNKDNSSSYKDHRFVGSLDEVRVWNRALSAAEVEATAAKTSPTAAESDAAFGLPAPVCHWAFDDASNVGKDSMGHADLIANPNLSTTPAVENKAGNYGKSLTRASSMKLPASNLPANFPVGDKPFTVSLRVQPGSQMEKAEFLTLGDPTDPAKSCRLFVNGSPRTLYASCGYEWNTTGRTHTDAVNEDSWRHVVVTYTAGESGVVTVYRDGRRVTQRTNRVNLSAADVWLNSSASRTGANVCQIDDVQIFDTALSAREVEVLTRSLATGNNGPVIPETASVTVDAGATLKIAREASCLATLTGRGDVELTAGARLKIGSATGFSGAVTGSGSMELGSGTSGASLNCDVTISPSARVVATGDAKACIETRGRVNLPDSGTLVFTAIPAAPSRQVIAKGASVIAKSGISGWTVEMPKTNNRTVTLKLEDGEFYADVKPTGLILIFK